MSWPGHMTKNEATLCLDLLRGIPGEGQDTWDWLKHRARDAGLTDQDVDGLPYEDAIVLISSMEEYWHYGPQLGFPHKKSSYVTEYDFKTRLVEELKLLYCAFECL